MARDRVSTRGAASIDDPDGDGPMPVARPSDHYDRTAVLLHWIIGIALLGETVFGFLLREVARGTPARGPLTNLHKSIGIVLGLAILARLAWRAMHLPPPLPSNVPRWQVAAARANHVAMYACMVIIPLAGYAASNFSKFGLKFFTTVILPPWGPDRPDLYAFFNGLHNVAAYILAALVVVHVLATFKHVLVDRDRPFARLSLRRDPGG